MDNEGYFSRNLAREKLSALKQKQAEKQLNQDVWNAVLQANQAYANTPVDQLYAFQGAPMNLEGQGLGGAEVSTLPEDIAMVVPWGKLARAGMAGVKGVAEAAPGILANEIGAIGKDISLTTPERAKELVNINLPKGMHRVGGESIPARELQLPNVRPELKSAKVLKQRPEAKESLGTSIGQGESVREGDIANAIEAAIRAIRYERRLPKPKLPK